MYCPKCGTENPEAGKFCRSCGTDLSGVSKALNKKSSKNQEIWGNSEDLWGMSANPTHMWQMSENSPESRNADDLFGGGVKGVIMGFGFLAVSMALLFTGVAGGKSWWWALLFPSFISFANGVTQILKANSLKRANSNLNAPSSYPSSNNQLQNPPQNLNLPASQTEYVTRQASIYSTGELIAPSSVTEHTTKHLELDKDGETMTLPKK